MKDGRSQFVPTHAGKQARFSFIAVDPKTGNPVRKWHPEIHKIYDQQQAKSLSGMVKP